VCAIFILGSLILAASLTKGALYFGRIVVGIGVAISAIVDVAYLTEVSPQRYRGAAVGMISYRTRPYLFMTVSRYHSIADSSSVVSFTLFSLAANDLMLAVGVLLAYSSGYGLSQLSGGWRVWILPYEFLVASHNGFVIR
jgi:MFS family permease